MGVWDPLHPGVGAPRRYTLVSMTAKVCGAVDEDKAMVSQLLHALGRPVMQLSHLLWRATALDHAVKARCVRRREALSRTGTRHYLRLSSACCTIGSWCRAPCLPYPCPCPGALTPAVAASWWSPSRRTTRVTYGARCSNAFHLYGC